MTRRFSQQELYELRNRVPITDLMQHVLTVPRRSQKGEQRYECPICDGYDTSVHKDHNLLRCFDCKRNFNPIDLVMNCLKRDFVESVNWLKQQQANRVYVEDPVGPREKINQAVHIGQILRDTLPARPDHKTISESKQGIDGRVDALENKIDRLFGLVAELKGLMEA